MPLAMSERENFEDWLIRDLEDEDCTCSLCYATRNMARSALQRANGDHELATRLFMEGMPRGGRTSQRDEAAGEAMADNARRVMLGWKRSLGPSFGPTFGPSDQEGDQMTPTQLADELGISPKTLRAWLRERFPRDQRLKNTRWTLGPAIVQAARARWSSATPREP